MPPRPKKAASPARPALPSPPPVIRGRVWVEIGNAAVLTDAGADLLDQIEACGSLSAAARRLRFSYRRAWLLVDAMNRHWPAPLVETATGGHKGGGARLTETGRNALRAYREVQLQVEHLLGRALAPFHLATKA